MEALIESTIADQQQKRLRECPVRECPVALTDLLSRMSEHELSGVIGAWSVPELVPNPDGSMTLDVQSLSVESVDYLHRAASDVLSIRSEAKGKRRRAATDVSARGGSRAVSFREPRSMESLPSAPVSCAAPAEVCTGDDGSSSSSSESSSSSSSSSSGSGAE
eukprot:TRINITY_DN2205_c0_g1_i2.p1 TRINITY_DN2205_c0_g1~~TRINITY_DN2205_c0_g1_i2.p1  ORF type:complete len:163 (-),score=32.07 TRINITY_DN2205_c0_g1_i2:87-575(-)